MGMTITEKILANASGRERVSPGENIWVSADILMTHDVCGPGTIGVFKREFGENAKVWDQEGVVIIPDHYIFTADEKCHRNVDALFGTDSHTCTHGALGEFATGIGNTDAGFVMGTGKLLIKVPPTIKFVIDGKLPKGVTAKDIILRIIGDIGVDGATYCAMEFAGTTIEGLSVEERMTICNMAIEAGGKNGIIAPDEKTIEYVKSKTSKPFKCFHSDPDAQYLTVRRYKAEEFVPVVAMPFSPDNVKSAKESSQVKIDRSYIGSCTGGKITDFIFAAELMKGHKVKVDTFLVPSTVEVEQAMKEIKIDGKTLVEIFAEAGCIEPAPPSCAACLGGPVDTFGRCNNGEVCVSTTNRNFPGRMGSKDSQTILASPYTAAASAITGHITDPREFLK